ncbi:hypothetical protein HU200_015804 [Digitaria exilis]|uniref:Uncharacterized protein n=1 Tax=Digitaria exilis TaxID=1010633 RepID=A0A835KIU2_9POAL|nr:hypothetical protein HU200_015804 [Digitaria exilis]
MNAAEITDKLGLHSLRQRHWLVSLVSASSYLETKHRTWIITLHRAKGLSHSLRGPYIRGERPS